MTTIKINYNPNKGDIVSRLFVSLSEGTGWAISKEPDLKADINYFPLYIQVGQSPNVVKQLKRTAAWFTHYEVQRKDKMDWWNIAASKVDIRTTTASQYYDMLIKTGETHLVYPPPIDPQFFLPQRKPRIGISGFVHPSGRKGEHLVKRLYDEMGSKWDIVATGQGWPIPDVKMRDFKDLPAFYKSLDVFLCTSLTEGIPMPPLEALACGVPIVIPNGVGILDQLSPSLFIKKYIADDYDDMLNAIDKMLYFSRTDTCIKDFTQEAWCKSHKEAFGMGDIVIHGDDKIEPLIVTESESKILDESIDRIVVSDEIKSVVNSYAENSDMKDLKDFKYLEELATKSGAICVAYGRPSLDCARSLIHSWNNHMRWFTGGFPIAMVSDNEIDVFSNSTYKLIKHPDTDIGARSVKTNLYNIAPENWEYVLYLDADTEIIDDVSILFKWLDDGFDFIICLNPSEHSTIKDGLRPDNRDEMDYTIEMLGSGDLLQFNGGVFAFRRNERTKSLMNSWHEEWSKWGARDQYALLRALHQNPVKLLVLGHEYNCILRSGVDLTIEDSAGIIHTPMRARRWDGLIYGDLRSEAAWKAVRDWNGKHAK